MKKLLLLSIILICSCDNSTEPEDCAGVSGGAAVLDSCEICVGGTTELIACIQDCAGVWGGTKINDCNGVCGGSAVEDACGTCGGGHIICPTSELCAYDGWLPNCDTYADPVNDCWPASWVGDSSCDDYIHVWGADFSCYSYDETSTLCQIPTLSDIESGLPDCIGNHGGPDNGDCDPCDPSSEAGWTPECPDGPPCEFCCDTYRDQCWTCHTEDNDGNCIHGCNLGCEAGCDAREWTWGCDNVCYENSNEAPTIDLCGICGGDGSSCATGD